MYIDCVLILSFYFNAKPAIGKSQKLFQYHSLNALNKVTSNKLVFVKNYHYILPMYT